MAFEINLRLPSRSLTLRSRHLFLERLGQVVVASFPSERLFSVRSERRGTTSVVVATILWLFSTCAPAAHSWYPVWCCSEKDCRELSEEKGETVLEAQDGWHLWDGRLVARGIAKPSPDRKFHICEEPTTRAIICFFAPPGAT
jgi:hypothetical protein